MKNTRVRKRREENDKCRQENQNLGSNRYGMLNIISLSNHIQQKKV